MMPRARRTGGIGDSTEYIRAGRGAAHIFLHLGRLSLRLSKRWNQFSKRNCQWSAAHHAWHRKIVVYLIWQHCKDLEWNYGDDIISWLFFYGSWLWI